MDYIDEFLQDCKLRGLTRHTIQTYASDVKSFLRVCSEPDKANLDQLKGYLGELMARNLSSSTVKGCFAALSTYYDYLVFDGAITANPVPSFRKRYLTRLEDDPEERQLVSVQQMQFLVSAPVSIRDKALILTLPKTGIRKGELLSMKRDDILLHRGIIRIAPKAKRSNRIVFLDHELRDILERYLAWRDSIAKTDWFWITDKGGRLKKDEPNRILAKYAEPLGLHDPDGPLDQKFTCHCGRHFFTSMLFRAGMDPEYIKFLRGDSLRKEAWQHYNHIDPEEVRQEYLRKIPKLISFDEKLERYYDKNRCE